MGQTEFNASLPPGGLGVGVTPGFFSDIKTLNDSQKKGESTETSPELAKALNKLTSEVKGLGVDLSGLLDEQGNLPADKLVEARKKIVAEAVPMSNAAAKRSRVAGSGTSVGGRPPSGTPGSS